MIVDQPSLGNARRPSRQDWSNWGWTWTWTSTHQTSPIAYYRRVVHASDIQQHLVDEWENDIVADRVRRADEEQQCQLGLREGCDFGLGRREQGLGLVDLVHLVERGGSISYASTGAHLVRPFSPGAEESRRRDRGRGKDKDRPMGEKVIDRCENENGERTQGERCGFGGYLALGSTE